MPSRRHSSAMLYSPRSPSSTILIFSSAEWCFLVARGCSSQPARRWSSSSRIGDELSAKLLGKPVPRATIYNSEPGLTDDDLGLLKFAVEQVTPEIKQALARQRPTQAVKEAVEKALSEAGIVLDARSPKHREMELAFLEQYAKALDVYVRPRRARGLWGFRISGDSNSLLKSSIIAPMY